MSNTIKQPKKTVESENWTFEDSEKYFNSEEYTDFVLKETIKPHIKPSENTKPKNPSH